MELEFLNELCESRMFRSRRVASQLNVDDAADLAFVNLMLITIFNKSYDFAPLASEYASRTMGYSNFERFRTNGTDLYIALNRLMGSDQEYEDEKDKIAIKRIKLDLSRLKRYLTAVERNEDMNAMGRELYRFEKDLNIQDSMLKSMRRLVSDWDNLSHSQKSVLVTRFKQFMTQRAQLADLTMPIVKFQKSQHLAVDDEKDRKKKIWNNPIVKAALAVGGPIAAYKAGQALGKHLGKTSYSSGKGLGKSMPSRLKK